MRSTSTKAMNSSLPVLSMQASRSCSLPATAWQSASMKVSSEPIGRVARGVRGVMLKNEQDYVVACEVVTPDQNVLVVCENGYGKRSKVDDFRQTNRGGVGVRSIITSQRNGLVVGAISVTDNDSVVLMSAHGQTVRMSMKDVRVMGRSTQGVRLVNLQDDTVVAVQKIENMKPEEITAEISPKLKFLMPAQKLKTSPTEARHSCLSRLKAERVLEKAPSSKKSTRNS